MQLFHFDINEVDETFEIILQELTEAETFDVRLFLDANELQYTEVVDTITIPNLDEGWCRTIRNQFLLY